MSFWTILTISVILLTNIGCNNFPNAASLKQTTLDNRKKEFFNELKDKANRGYCEHLEYKYIVTPFIQELQSLGYKTEPYKGTDREYINIIWCENQ